MGRYRAPQVDEDDDGQEVFPMDWDVIPDDVAEDHAVGSNFARIGRRDDDDDDDDDDGCYGSQTQRLVCTQRDEISHNILEQQKNCLLKAKRSAAIRRTITITAVTIFSVVLKRYAPPPPPILNLSPIDTSKLSTDHTIDTTTDYYAVRHLPDQSVHGNASGMGGVIQHETWARYSRHLLYLVYHAMVYVPSVAWYALSNSFRYAWDEMRDGYVVFWQRSDDARNENLFWTYPNMEKLISIITSIRSHVKHYVKLDEGDSHATTDIQNQKDIKVDELELPICMHAAPDNRKTWSARCGTAYRDDSSTSESAVDSWSTEDYLRQMIGTSLSPQNMALKIIAERLDTWGLLSVEEAQASASSGDSSSALPPAIGFLLVGPEGVGKMRTARRLEKYLLAGHCSDDTYLSRGVLEVLVAPGNVERAQSMTEMIVDHIHSRGGLGSVIIIHHIESMPVSFVTEISHVISGKYHSLSYQTPEILVEASCNGTVFVMTSRQWGTKSIFQTIQQNGGLNRLSRETIIQSIRREVDDAHLAHFSKLASHTTIAPVLPFQQEDLSSILHGRIQALNLKYQGIHWKRLEVSLAAIRYFAGFDHVEYSYLFDVPDKHAEIDENEKTRVAAASFTFSTRGAHALDRNALLEEIQSMSITGTQSRPRSILKIGLDDFSKEATFRWCNYNNGLESCDVEWRSFLA